MTRWLTAAIMQLALGAGAVSMATPPEPAPGERVGPDALAEVAGDYVLVGVMETAAELRLTDGGRFDWLLSVGSLDLPVSGTYRYFPPHLFLDADGAKAVFSERVRLLDVQPMPDDVPETIRDLAAHPRAVAVRLLGHDCATCNLAVINTDAEPMDQVRGVDGEGLQPAERIVIGVLPEGRRVSSVHFIIEEGESLQGEVVMEIAPGHMATFRIQPSEGDRDVPRVLHMQLERLDDGRLVPTDTLFSQPEAHYVRQ